MSDDLVEEVCNTILEWVGDVIDHEHAMSVARAAIACVQQHFDLPPTKSEMDLRLELGRTQAEVVHTQDELGALLHAAEAKLAEVQRCRPIETDLEAAAVEWRNARQAVFDAEWGDPIKAKAQVSLWTKLGHAEAALMAIGGVYALAGSLGAARIKKGRRCPLHGSAASSDRE